MNKLDELEERVLNLQYKELKKSLPGLRQFSITPKASAKTSPISPTGLTISSRRRGGSTSYSVRYASGATATLPADRASWPADIRAMIEKIEEFDKKRNVGGRMISASIGGGLRIE
jgi:hypothetical protein